MQHNCIEQKYEKVQIIRRDVRYIYMQWRPKLLELLAYLRGLFIFAEFCIKISNEINIYKVIMMLYKP